MEFSPYANPLKKVSTNSATRNTHARRGPIKTPLGGLLQEDNAALNALHCEIEDAAAIKKASALAISG
jgi:hypothetical protein